MGLILMLLLLIFLKNPEDVSHVLDRLAERGSVLPNTLSQVVTHATRNISKSKLNDSPLPEDVLNAALKVCHFLS